MENFDFNNVKREHQRISNNILKSYTNVDDSINDEQQATEFLEKGGKRAQIGETRMYGGRQYIKTADGWKFHGKGTGAKTKQHIESTKQYSSGDNKQPSSQNEQKPKSTPKWNLEGKSQKQLEDELKDLKYNDSKDNLTNTGKSKIKAIEDKLSQMSSDSAQSSNDSKDSVEQQSQNEVGDENSFKNYNHMNYDINPDKLKIGDIVEGIFDNGVRVKGFIKQLPSDDNDEFVIQKLTNSGEGESFKIDFTQLNPLVRVKEGEYSIDNRLKRGYDEGDVVFYNDREYQIGQLNNKGGAVLYPINKEGKVSISNGQKVTGEKLRLIADGGNSYRGDTEVKDKYRFNKLYYQKGLNKLSLDKQIDFINGALQYYDLNSRKSSEPIPDNLKPFKKEQLLIKKEELQLQSKGIPQLKQGDKIQFEKMNEFGANDNKYEIKDISYDDYYNRVVATVRYEQGTLIKTLNVPLSKITANNGQ